MNLVIDWMCQLTHGKSIWSWHWTRFLSFWQKKLQLLPQLGSAWLASAPWGVVRCRRTGHAIIHRIYRRKYYQRKISGGSRACSSSSSNSSNFDPIHSAFGFRCACRVGLRRGVTRRVTRGSGSRLWSSRCALRRSESIERKGKKSFRQTRIPEASSLQGSRINDLSVRWFFEFSVEKQLDVLTFSIALSFSSWTSHGHR